MNYLKQILAEFKEQSLAIWLSIVGTALAIFIVMAVFIVTDIPYSEVRPESCRKSLLIGMGIDFVGDNGGGVSAGLSKKWAENLYGDLDGIEKMAFFSSNIADISAPGHPIREMDLRTADDRYWDVFDFKFIAGKPYTKEENDAKMKVAVLSERTARMLFGTTDVVGREFNIAQLPYKVTGVIQDVSPLFQFAYGDVYIPMEYGTSRGDEDWMTEYMGQCWVALMKKPGVSDESIKAQVKARYDMANGEIKKRHWELKWHESPYNIEEYEALKANPYRDTPDTSSSRRIRWLIYTVLLLIPAINLSGMSRSRLHRRISEIGVRRAFGATRLRVVGELLAENFFITLLGGALVFIFCMIAVGLFTNLFVNTGWAPIWWDYHISGNPTFDLIFSWKAFGFAILFCFFLNLFSSGIPVWKAASVNPAEAISGNEETIR